VTSNWSAPHQKPLPPGPLTSSAPARIASPNSTLRKNRTIERRIRKARFPVLKTLEEFQ